MDGRQRYNRSLLVREATSTVSGCTQDDVDLNRIRDCCKDSGFRVQQAPPRDEYGIQGEIGYLAVNNTLSGVRLHLKCDCGESNQIAPHPSGYGVRRVLKWIEEHVPLLKTDIAGSSRAAVSTADLLLLFGQAVAKGNSAAMRLMFGVLRPLFDVVRATLHLDPQINRVVLRDRLVDGFSSSLQNCLLNDLDGKTGLYLIREIDSVFFRKHSLILLETEAYKMIGVAFATSIVERAEA
ncbi:hypothetical protein G6L12_31160 [Agrobacterium rhizogenes]|nr:hypothetical protein [Rhizobium rhizogenes]NTF78964.1 hypothetical protein [Rhizobium rhizogenes]